MHYIHECHFDASTVQSSVLFYHSKVHIGGLASFQVLIETPTGLDLSAISFSSLSLEVLCVPSSQGAQPSTRVARVRHQGSSSDGLTLKHAALTVISFEDGGDDDFLCDADLSFTKGSSLLLSGNVSSHYSGRLEVCACSMETFYPLRDVVQIAKATLTIVEGNWIIDCPISLGNGKSCSRWFTSLEPAKSVILPQEEPAACA